MTLGITRALTAFALGMILTLTNGRASVAGCAQRDLAGSWNLMGTVLATNSQGYWITCTINIPANGRISDGFCLDAFGNGTELTGRAQLVTIYACQFTAQLNRKTGGSYASVQHAQLSIDKNTLVGGGFSNSALFTFTMLRIS